MTWLWWYVAVTQTLMALFAFHNGIMNGEGVLERYVTLALFVVVLVPLFALLWLVHP